MVNRDQFDLEVCLSPALLHLFDTRDKHVVVIDIFRATSTITTALFHGAKEVIPVDSVASCLALGQQIPGSLMAGERDGKIAEGLQYGNSPSEYPRSFIQGKTLVLTTTNGTRLLHMIQGARELLIGSFLNLSTLASYLQKADSAVLLCCSAWKDRVNLEDSLFAGALVEKLSGHMRIGCDSARMVRRMYREASAGSLVDYLRDSAHYQRLSSFGLEADMAYCLSQDLHPVIPQLRGHALFAIEG